MMAWHPQTLSLPQGPDRMSSRFDVIGFGAIAVDHIVYVDRPLSAGKGKVTGQHIGHGGNIATALAAVARLGGRAAFIGWLPEPDADLAGLELERDGVDIAMAPRRPDAAPIRSVITVGPDGDRFIAYDDDVPHGTSDTLADGVLTAAPVLLIDGYAAYSPVAVSQAKALGVRIVADIEWSIGEATERVMALADHLVLPMAFGRLATEADNPATILDRLWREDLVAAVLTDGERGAYLRQSGDTNILHLPAYVVDAVDTTGAGDCFHGAYALATARGEVPLECLAYATAAAALSVTVKGGREGLPSNEACRQLMTSPAAPVASVIEARPA